MTDSSPTVLALDIASGGASAGLVDSDLRVLKSHEVAWELVGQPSHGTLSPALVLDAVGGAIRGAADVSDSPDALALSSMMHTLLVTGGDGVPRTPVFTWLDRRDDGIGKRFGERLGADYCLRTGAYFHPSFPTWKLAGLRARAPNLLEGAYRIGSVKSYVQEKLTGNPADDLSTASASGMLNLRSGDWDPATLEVLEVDRSTLPTLLRPADVAGTLSDEAAEWLGLAPRLPVVTGGGDGFLASLGSGCDRSDRIAVTLGTTAGVRRFTPVPEVDPGSGTFCYRYDQDTFLVGCASNNGGNVLDWARTALGPLEYDAVRSDRPGPPLFLPFLYGERSPFWDLEHGARFVGVTNRHSPQDLADAVVEGIAFHLAVYSELVASRLKDRPKTLVLSGNGFRFPQVARLLRAVTSLNVLAPDVPGAATLRGAARCGFQALGVATTGGIEALIADADNIEPYPDRNLETRFERFKAVYDRRL